jgi:hypothetical protein
MARKNKTLSDLGFDIDPETFEHALTDTFDSMHRDNMSSLDELLVRPTRALIFCEAIRERLNEYDLPEDVILRTLLNLRKHG